MSGIKDKVALILGGAGGIGSAAAQDLAAKGAKVAIADINRPQADIVAKRIQDRGGVARAYPVDITNKDQVKALVEHVVRDYGALDALINCAGIMFVRPLSEINTEEWETTIDLNVKGALWAIAASLPLFLEQQRGHIINLSSVHGLKVFSPGGAVHSASKFALRALCEGVRAELANTPIRSSLITPGAVDTGMQYKTTGSDSARMLAIYKNAIPAEAVARAITFAMEQPPNVDVNEIVIRPTAQAI
ncbi:SDR family oxidoreductase [Bradyrhizobium ottawaense]|jgi:NADP-dependent 3-hydroxy acid dehydrogenase YdfG|uniref:NADP-dependent 3-hydroxy acid dehydrogenase YdfG n=1 Tax=Bradyrhizobium elkanii TaxID=29448 RepID=A0ABV4FI19_BRAEL|nr:MULTISPECIES: SDR family oxidoreductase [Bradyrhizobium]MBR1335235.1 SDR family oxidoreductase [Bradyrhizobium ottawaense]MBR1364914.1 SDR family oxidoreductase [Bradyrhizobium ottawaense]MCP1754105.1 NADP-dependent 3-hydroxy acid dehydrogenase YdfG [Bradyrhizobium elkanii]MCP1979625.1 NADP-dependent 3-hydroxy acid dehydrogenase YdfG [Bradyrhizobium elkanii]MCS3885600.1 NADP-dependent 3-hydroxy acid dehydrogenase YdfG [Bradyrhizobium elkanii]